MSKLIIMLMLAGALTGATYFITRPNPIMCLSSNSLTDEVLLATNGESRGWPISYAGDMPWHCGEGGETSRYYIDNGLGILGMNLVLNTMFWFMVLFTPYGLIKLRHQK